MTVPAIAPTFGSPRCGVRRRGGLPVVQLRLGETLGVPVGELAIAQRIVKRRGGEIGYRHADGRTRFWFRLPCTEHPTQPGATERQQATVTSLSATMAGR